MARRGSLVGEEGFPSNDEREDESRGVAVVDGRYSESTVPYLESMRGQKKLIFRSLRANSDAISNTNGPLFWGQLHHLMHFRIYWMRLDHAGVCYGERQRGLLRSFILSLGIF